MTEDDKLKFWISIMNNTASNLQFLNRQQWTVVNYCLLIYGGIYAFHVKIGKGNFEIWALATLLTLVCCAGCFYLITLKNSMRESRKEIERIYRKNKEAFDDIGTDIVQKDGEKMLMVILFSTLILGVLLTGTLICLR